MKRIVIHAFTGFVLGAVVCLPLNQALGATKGGEVYIENPNPPPVIEKQLIARTSQLLGKEVKNTKGVYLGSCRDLIFSKGGCLSYLILERGSAFGAVGPLIAIPWSLVMIKEADKSILLDLPYEAIRDAPGFPLGHWPDFLSPDEVQKIDRHYRQYR
jgi:sporulation protein YlmC with PRC-barrel domain